MAVTPLRPESATGVVEQDTRSVVQPMPPHTSAEHVPRAAPGTLPSWRYPFDPQHCTVPPDKSAQAKSKPAPMDVTPVSPVTAAGVDEEVVVPLPSWP